MLQALHDAAQFGEPFQSAHQRIARIYFLADVVGQQVSVVGTHGNFMVGPARASPLCLFFHHSADHAHHIGTAGQVLRFVKRSVAALASPAADAQSECERRIREPWPAGRCRLWPERPDTKRQPVGERIASGENRPHILGGRNDSREAEQRPRRIVRMYREANTDLLCHRDNFPQECDEIGSQFGSSDTLVFSDQPANRLAIVRCLGAREPGDDRLLQFILRASGMDSKRVRAA